MLKNILNKITAITSSGQYCLGMQTNWDDRSGKL